MSSGSGWETVTGKKGIKNLKNSKSIKKTSLENMPRIEPAAPVKESPTIYQAFLEEELKKERKLLESEKESNLKDGVKKLMPNQLQKEKDRNLSLKDSLQSLNFAEMEEVIRKDQTSFPKNPEIWLKDLVSVVNFKLDHIADSDPILADKPYDYPLCFMSDDAKTFFSCKLFNHSLQVYESLLDHCIDFMMSAISKDQSSLGYKLIIQMLLQQKPEVVLNNIAKFQGLVHRNSSRPLRSLCVLWAVGQVGHLSLSHGIKIWCNLMFGFINVKNLNNYVVSYLENLFERHQNLEEGFNAMTKTDYFKFLGELFSELSSVSADIKKRLHQVYPKIKIISWGNVSTNINIFFPGYLTRLTPDCHEAKRNELLQCLVACLESDVQSFAHWRRDYHKTINQSSLLLKYLEKNLEKLKLNKRIFFETVKAFQLTNEELLTKAPADQNSLLLSENSCKAILRSWDTTSFPIKSVLVGLFSMLLLSFSLETLLHGSFKGSLAYELISSTGAMQVFDNASQRLILYSQKANQWLSDNYPGCFERIYELLSMGQLGSTKVLEYISGQQPLLTFRTLSEKLTKLLPYLLYYLHFVSQFLLDALGITFTKLAEVFDYIYIFLVNNQPLRDVLPESMLETIQSFFSCFHNNINNLYLKFKSTSDAYNNY